MLGCWTISHEIIVQEKIQGIFRIYETQTAIGTNNTHICSVNVTQNDFACGVWAARDSRGEAASVFFGQMLGGFAALRKVVGVFFEIVG